MSEIIVTFLDKPFHDLFVHVPEVRVGFVDSIPQLISRCKDHCLCMVKPKFAMFVQRLLTVKLKFGHKVVDLRVDTSVVLPKFPDLLLQFCVLRFQNLDLNSLNSRDRTMTESLDTLQYCS